MTADSAPSIAIACGGTGGHLFPGQAVAAQLARRGCTVTLLVSPKDVDQQAVKAARGMEIVTLPAVGLSHGRRLAFLRGFVRSYRAAADYFDLRPQHAVLAMGGFTGAPPVLAARHRGARTFIHESNTIPGRANRWLAHVVDQVFVGFPQAGSRLRNQSITCTGTPVRPQFQPRDVLTCRVALGLQPARPVLLIMGGSQGARAVNELLLRTLPLLAQQQPELQLLHLAGPNDAEKVRAACAALKIKAVVHGFFAEMDLALAAASAAVSRAGASSLAELAAMRVPAVLVPFPAATDNHQFHNARAFAQTGAAVLLEQGVATPERLAGAVLDLIGNPAAREKMRTALAAWHTPGAAERIAENILSAIYRRADEAARRPEERRPKSEPRGQPSGEHERRHFSAA